MQSSKGEVKISFTAKEIVLDKCNIFIVTTPTFINKFRSTDLSSLLAASLILRNILTTIKKVISGLTLQIAGLINELYASVIATGTYLSKAIESVQHINISFINGLALIFDHMDIYTNSVFLQAQQQMFFLDFKPRLVGGII